MKDFYYILGLEADCTLDDIKEAYRKLSKKLHPDLNQGDTYFENRFRDINEAFETLNDPVKRARYDHELRKSRSTGIDEEPKRRTYQSPPPPVYKMSRKRGIGLGMTIVLILLAIIISDYLIRSFSKSKTSNAKTGYVAKPALYKSHKYHRRRHIQKNNAVADSSSKPNKDTTANKAAQSKPAFKPGQPKPGPNANQPKQIPVIVKPALVKDENTSSNKDYLYNTYVRPNATGVVYMRRFDTYNSEIIEKIPANSKVFVLERGDTYYKVAFDTNIGYVPKWALQVK